MAILTRNAVECKGPVVQPAGWNRWIVYQGGFHLVTFRLEWRCSCHPTTDPVWFWGGYQPTCQHIQAIGGLCELARQYDVLREAGI